MSDNDEDDERGMDISSNDLVDYTFEDDQTEFESLNVQLEEKSKVYPQQKFLANHLLRRIKFVQKDAFEKYKRIDFQVSAYFYVPLKSLNLTFCPFRGRFTLLQEISSKVKLATGSRPHLEFFRMKNQN